MEKANVTEIEILTPPGKIPVRRVKSFNDGVEEFTRTSHNSMLFSNSNNVKVIITKTSNDFKTVKFKRV